MSTPWGIVQERIDVDESQRRVPRLSADCDPTGLDISAAEGFLLSRIDGQTPWRLLREIGGLSPDAADRCLEDWLSQGLIVVEEKKTAARVFPRPALNTEKSDAAPAKNEAAQSHAGPVQIDESLFDESLDLSLEVQRGILEFEAGLHRSYHELLGVGRGTDGREIKRAYLALSKEYHPDRYFRRNIGPYAECLGGIFKKILEAYEILSDPTTRAEVEKSMDAEPPPAPPSDATQHAGSPPPPRPLTPIERLRQRLPFRIPASLLAERRAKAAEFFKVARVSQGQKKYIEAASTIRLAIAFDPGNREYRDAFGEVQAHAAELRAAQLLENAESSFSASELNEALRLYEEVLLYRPHDPEVNDKAANLALELDETEKAREYSERAIEHSPHVARYLVTRAQVYRADGDKGHALREIEKAIEMDPSDPKARKLLEMLTRSRRPKAPGGM